eukprot:CAMPEP_0203672868 /NCGR_PEP_ID=MMETSP0090-20130426/9608_1 /ASSEMBLY_ACC=CAM_ASM_001088 /TAXON_ID=426623 /ORGANISM="Chaetoceros affinis, Strain CCMP159" /LENGTH=630 /DNA_ID=CAMNT_0050538303 /DNA_START=54 /DNA_END=1946 /DNA_ORIENTATION=+
MKSNYKYTDLFFSTSPCLRAHVRALLRDAPNYKKELQFICESGTFEVTSPAARARILAALHITSNHKTVPWFLKKCTGAEVAKALSLLDRSRKLRQLQQKIQKIESIHPNLIDATPKENKSKVSPTKAKTSRKKKAKSPRQRKIDLYRQLSKTIQAELSEPAKEVSIGDNDDSAVTELIQSASVSGALARKVREWAKSNLEEHELQMIMLGLPKGPWVGLADLVHFRPDDFAARDFLVDIHNKNDKKSSSKEEESDVIKDSSAPAPASSPSSSNSSFVSSVRMLKDLHGDSLTAAFFNIASTFKQSLYQSYSYIRTQPELMSSEAIVIALCENIPLDTAIWWFEELNTVSRKCEDIVSKRLSDVRDNNILSSSKLTYGKLVERLLTFQKMNVSFAKDLVPLATSRLGALKEYWKEDEGDSSKVAVFGDASSSMQLAIEASTIFASMVAACFDAELSFFSSGLVKSPHEKPHTVKETLEVCKKIRANGCTSLAAALWPYYSNKIVMDTFVLVTDEEENTQCNGYMFAPLLAEYKKHVNEDVNLIVVRVGRGDTNFQQSLGRNGINYKVVGIDSTRPDLAKFDALLGQVHMISSSSRKIKEQTCDNKSLDSTVMVVDDEDQHQDDFVVVNTA